MSLKIQFFNSRDTAQILGVDVSTIKRWTEEGKLACIKTAGGHRKFLMRHLADFVQKYETKPARTHPFPMKTRKDLQIGYWILNQDLPHLREYLFQEALNANRFRILQVLNALYFKQYPLFQIYDQLITPVMQQIGDGWVEKKIAIIQEHLASQMIFECLARLQGMVSLPVEKIGSALCLNLSFELHSFALKMVEYLLEVRGFKVYFCGANTPVQDLPDVLTRLRPDRIYISSTYVSDPTATQAEFDLLCRYCEAAKVEVYVGGRGFNSIQLHSPAVVRRLSTFGEVMQY